MSTKPEDSQSAGQGQACSLGLAPGSARATPENMNIIQKLFALFGADYAVLIFYDNGHSVRRVRWYQGVPFCAPYLPNTSAILRPRGELIGKCYLSGWLPATPRMQHYFNGTKS